MRKGELTRTAILAVALDLASREGIEGLTIGLLAEKMGMSKSGVFSHFGSREDLQIAVVKQYHDRFEQAVFYPSLQKARGLPRLRAMFEGWIKRVSVELASGCIYISGAVEYDDKPGPVRDALIAIVKEWREALLKCVRLSIEVGDLKENTDPLQVVYELNALVLGLHHDTRFLQIPGSIERAQLSFERLIQNYQTTESLATKKLPPATKKAAQPL